MGARDKSRAVLTPNERTRRRLASYKARRIALIIKLAPKLECAVCGDDFEDPAELTIDHVDGRTWSARKLSPQMRVARYWREHEAGVRLRAVCGRCMVQDGGLRRWGGALPPPPADDDDEEVPF